MYLKSLVLKGFKSFADRSVLSLEPGITAIVGPNGSGKSNISDAVLWVLGERNARHLRGQAMEDVIFAGSSARKQVGMAEVVLVLDNSDATLPVDFDEVAITRRMYRSGESEYLINGTAARRMDVLDILHDSGLGTGTHSIISQGSLDSILQSKPEDRRALIEEAAGVLKHKQRKAKSERKLAAMDENLTRVRDIAREVERQLGPLERKAKRAQTYVQLSSQLADLNLALVVDELRALQRGLGEVQAREQELNAQIEQRRADIEAADAQVEALQERIRRESIGAGELAAQQRRASSAVERFDGTALMLREKRRAAQGLVADLTLTSEKSQEERKQAAAAHEQARGQLAQAQAARAQADAAVARLAGEQAECAHTRDGLEAEARRCEAARREGEREREAVRRELAQTQEALASGLAHTRLAESRRTELELALSRAEQDGAEAAAAAQEARAACERAAQLEAAARAELAQATAEREAVRATLDEARDAAALLEGRVHGLEEAMRAASASNPALAWVIEHAGELGGGLAPLAEAIRVPQDLEPLVEHLLGAEASAYLADNRADMNAAALQLARREAAGQVVLVARDAKEQGAAAARAAAAAGLGRALIDEVSYPAEAAAAVELLLGDVVVCDALADALSAQGRCADEVRFAALDGAIVWPGGKVSVGRCVEPGEEGVLARARRLEDLRGQLREASAAVDAAAGRAQTCDEALRGAQAKSLQRAQELAGLRGKRDAAAADARRAEEKLAAARRELADAEAQRVAAAQAVDAARPQAEQLQQRQEELTGAIEEAEGRAEELQGQLEPLRTQAARLRDELAEARLSAATLAEREGYAARVVEAREGDIRAAERAGAQAREGLSRKRAACERIEPLLATLELLGRSARARLRGLEEASSSAQESTSGLHAQVSEARGRSRAAHDAFDALNAKLSESRVEEGRLEVRANAAVDAIVGECGTPLDHAFELPALQDRDATEQEAFKLRRRIANMGTINPDAAQEYEQVKERFDYLSAQLADLEGARRSLSKIVRVVDARMKDDFVRTYEQVDANFQEIFAVLFPGGQAHLSLVDPDDVENTGVEVCAQPRGKRIAKMSLMSGGEKSLTALALLFAVYRTRSTPFYILDEVEAALDDTNLRRLIAYLDELRDDTQLIMITHQRRTMETADVLFGVSMQADGVTKVISQKLDRALQYAQ